MLRAHVKQKPDGRHYARIVWASNGREIVPETTAYKRQGDLVHNLRRLIQEWDIEVVKVDGSKTVIEA